MSIQIDLRQVTIALSNSIDLVGIDSIQHGKRVAYMAAECGKRLNLTLPESNDLFHAGLLHDCGVSKTEVHHQLVSQMEWEGAEDHCVRGARLIQQFDPLAHLADVIRYHHTRWDLMPKSVQNSQTGLFANLIFLVDRVDALLSQSIESSILLQKERVRDGIKSQTGSLFAPVLVDQFLDTSDTAAFWLTLAPDHLSRYLYDRERETNTHSIELSELIHLGKVFSQIVDAKSPFTHQHSLGVAALASYLGDLAGLSSERCDMLEVAGLLHDLGKLRVPDEILDKPAPLDDVEQAIIHQHSFDTYQILKRIDGIEEIAEWAAYHHEVLSGDGYPFKCQAEAISLEARIVAVADIFQALAQERPYRGALSPEEILALLKQHKEAHRLDANIIQLVEQNLQQCWLEATQPAQNMRHAVSA